jgi:dolichol-phosphate mannosyltransferase
LTPDSELRKSSWQAPPPGFQAIAEESQLPKRVGQEEHLFLVPSFELAEALIERGADSARVAVGTGDDAEDWIQALADSLPGDPLIPPKPFGFPWRSLVILPTYNERENLEQMTQAIFRYLKTDILVVDDNSPDGTGKIADGLAAADKRIRVLHRTQKEGLGKAYLAGFRLALEEGYERIFETDCDFSHAPWDLPRLMAASEQADLVIGSRYVRGGSTVGWALPRVMLSRSANFYTRSWLGFKVHDWTAGFRCYHASLLKKLDFGQIAANGYSFQIEMTWRSLRLGAKVRELPTRFVDRNMGKSKMSKKIAFEAIRIVPWLRLKG